MPDGLAGIEADELASAGGAKAPLITTLKAITSALVPPTPRLLSKENDSRKREIEGPFGDYPKYMMNRPALSGNNSKCDHCRKDAIYHNIVPAIRTFLAGGVPGKPTC